MRMDQLTSRFLPTLPFEPFLLAADIDGTLLGDDQGSAWLKELSLCSSEGFYPALVTGRLLPSVLTLIEEGCLPQPDFICYDVGTELLDCADPEKNLGQKYAAQGISGWDLESIYSLGEGEGVWRQDFPEGQPRFQAGFYWDGQQQTLPLGEGKGVRFLQRELGLDPAGVVVAGDADNDLQMFETGYKGILPVNAWEELKTAACAPWHYLNHLLAARGFSTG